MVPTGGGEALAIGAEGHSEDMVRMAARCHPLVSRARSR
jgi:hypothetical protein